MLHNGDIDRNYVCCRHYAACVRRGRNTGPADRRKDDFGDRNSLKNQIPEERIEKLLEKEHGKRY